ncbi:MAG: ArsR/SmtB family transcription factor [Aggregatilineales bacterium]
MMATNLNPILDFVPAEELIVEDLDTLKVLADPLRLRIFELMTDPCTVKQVAAELDIPPTKLYYHINLLEKHGVIVLVDTRIVSGIIEKHYQVAAKSVRVARHLLSPGDGNSDEGMLLTINSIFDHTRQDLIESMRCGMIDMDDEDAPAAKQASIGTTRFFLTDDQAETLHQRLGELMKEFHDISEVQRNDDNTQVYKSLMVLFPTKSRIQSDDSDSTK